MVLHLYRARAAFAALAFFVVVSARSAQSAPTPVVYVGDTLTNAVYAFDANNFSRPPLAKITNGIGTPFGLGVDANGLLYVANSSAVEVYRPGGQNPIRTIADVPHPYAVGFGPNHSLAVTGIYSGGGMMAVYDSGSRIPTRLVTFPPGRIRTEVSNPVFDSAGNLYVAVHQYPRGPAIVFKFSPSAKQGVDTGLPFCNAMAIDARNNIYLAFGSQINAYHPGKLTPFRKITNGLVSQAEFTVTGRGDIFAVNTDHYVGGVPTPGNVVEYGPRSNNPVATLEQPTSITAPFGVAAGPGT